MGLRSAVYDGKTTGQIICVMRSLLSAIFYLHQWYCQQNSHFGMRLLVHLFPLKYYKFFNSMNFCDAKH